MRRSDALRSAAELRGVASFFAELHADPQAVRVCHGTSCALAGADALHAALAERGPCRAVYCLGHCERAPTLLLPDGRVVVEARPETAMDDEREPPRPSIRSASRTAIVTARIGVGDHSELDVARRAGAWSVLPQVRARAPTEIVDAIASSGERGRGGAAFPTGAKWRLAASTPASHRWVIANGDEGDPGSFIDRVLMEDDPHAVLEGMAICAHAIGAAHGLVYIRAEYPRAQARMSAAIEQARAAGLLDGFEVRVFPGMGSYVCGEETALIEAVEGGRGEVRLRPPYPAQVGLFGEPTVVNNVETFVNVPWIVAHGPRAYAELGTSTSPGTKAVCLNAGFARPGIVEVELGTPLREVIEQHGGGGRDGPLEAVLVGGPMGSVLVPDEWDVPLGYDEMAARGIVLGHAGLVAVPRGTDWRALMLHWLRFVQHESCGRCVPCRMGSQRALELAQRGARAELEPLLDTISAASLCAFGQLAVVPVAQMIRRFGGRIFGGDGG